MAVAPFDVDIYPEEIAPQVAERLWGDKFTGWRNLMPKEKLVRLIARILDEASYQINQHLGEIEREYITELETEVAGLEADRERLENEVIRLKEREGSVALLRL